MKYFLPFLGILLYISCKNDQYSTSEDFSSPKYAMVIHGGAGTILKNQTTDHEVAAYRLALDSALSVGERVLSGGGSALDAVEETISYLESNPLFNAGKGAVFTHDGGNELDASIMDGRDLNAGAVAGVKGLKHPIRAARAVMEKSEHVMLSGEGALQFSIMQGIEEADPEYFYTERRWKALERIRDEEGVELDHDDRKHGTVGAVALDMDGNIAAGTSTGGMTNKRYNRIGDSPIIGAGTYADNKTCGISCTGHGEYFIRNAAAYQVAAQMQYGEISLKEAADHVIFDVLSPDAGAGGLIGIDGKGHIVMPFNTPGMYRGYVTDTDRYVGIFSEN